MGLRLITAVTWRCCYVLCVRCIEVHN